MLFIQADGDELDVEVLQHCLDLVTRLTYATNQRFLKYSERLSRAGYSTCGAFATSGRMYDTLWFTPAVRADVSLLRVACGDPAFVAGMKQILRGDWDPDETYTRVASALRARGILWVVSHPDELHGLRD
jgi:hypothetical protein